MTKALLKFMSLEILKKRLKDNDISGVFLFCGPEEYMKDHYAGLLRKKVDASPLPEFNHIYFDASSSKLADLEDAIYSLPYMWDRKLIEITDLESARITENDANEYSRMFSDIPEYLTILVILRADEQTEESRLSKSKSGIGLFIEAVKENGVAVEFETENANKLETWIARHFNANDIKFESNVPREMMNVCGSDMYILQGEIKKLIEVYSKKPLTVSDVRTYCCANVAYKYFDIATALNRRDLISAKRILEGLDLSREKLQMAVGFLAKNYSEMLLVKTALEAGKGFDLIAKDLKIPSWRIPKISQSLGQADVNSLYFAINQLALADQKIKSFRGNPQRVLEMAFYRICTYGRKA